MLSPDSMLSPDDTVLFIAILLGFLIIFIIYPKMIKEVNKENFDVIKKFNEMFKGTKEVTYYDNNVAQNNDDTKLPLMHNKVCSKQCCKFIQWPTPFNTTNPNVNKDLLDNYIPTNLNCGGGNGGGCVCVSKDDYKYLADHGQK